MSQCESDDHKERLENQKWVIRLAGIEQVIWCYHLCIYISFVCCFGDYILIFLANYHFFFFRLALLVWLFQNDWTVPTYCWKYQWRRSFATQSNATGFECYFPGRIWTEMADDEFGTPWVFFSSFEVHQLSDVHLFCWNCFYYYRLAGHWARFY